GAARGLHRADRVPEPGGGGSPLPGAGGADRHGGPPAGERPGGAAVSGPPRRSARRRAGIAMTVLLAAVLLLPVVLTAWGAFSGSGWYGRRSEGAAVAGTPGLFRYVLAIWGGALRRSLALVLVVVPAALLLGAPAAYAFRRLPFPGARLLEAMALA